MVRVAQTFYWVIANLRGRLVVIGPKPSEQEATEFAYQKLDVPFDIISLQTRDRNRATSQIKAKRLDATGNLEQSIQRAKHKLPGDSDDSDGFPGVGARTRRRR